MVRVHEETRRTSLYANPHHIVRIQGMSEADSDALVEGSRPSAWSRHRRSTSTSGSVGRHRDLGQPLRGLHKACGGYPLDEQRIHWRTTIMQDELRAASRAA